MSEQTRIEDQLRENGIYAGLTTGVSMRPMLRTGRDTILISPVDGRLKRYDVPLYKRGDVYILHRVIRVCEDGYVIRGDNCLTSERVSDEQIVGVLSGFRRGQSYVAIDDKRYLFYAKLWVAIHPIRCIPMFLRAVAGRCYHRLFSKK